MKKNITIPDKPLDTEERFLTQEKHLQNNNSNQEDEYDDSESESESSQMMNDDGFQAEKVVVLNNQFEEEQLIPLMEDVYSEDEENQIVDHLEINDNTMNEQNKINYNYLIINKMVAKVQKDKESIEKKLINTKESNYDYAIEWNKEEKLHKEVDLSIEEGQRDIIILKKKKLERLRRDILNIRNLQNEVDPELYLQIKTINFKKGTFNSIKDFFASIDLIINKNSLIGFTWEKFSERVFKNKDTVDAFIYKLKYFPFNEMTDYNHSICIKFSEGEKVFLELFEQKGNRKVPYEIYIIKTFVEWMKIMRYGYELNLELIESIKKANLQKIEVDKISMITDLLTERKKNQMYQRHIFEEQFNQLNNLFGQLQLLKQTYQLKYKINEI